MGSGLVSCILMQNGNYKLSAEEREEKMKVHYDNEVDAIHIKLGNQRPDGVVEISEGVNLDTTSLVSGKYL